MSKLINQILFNSAWTAGVKYNEDKFQDEDYEMESEDEEYDDENEDEEYDEMDEKKKKKKKLLKKKNQRGNQSNPTSIQQDVDTKPNVSTPTNQQR